MICEKCGHAIPEGADFCPLCGEKTVQGGSDPETPIYQADVKTLLKSGRLIVYRDRTEFVTSSV
ncbi:MAG: zinc ribbon domain-containing protein, partial [Oscillospiraceae bacterium]|nr:zinc ribbon domain-containing protein [Oscillospiraceae bacterium]